MIEVFWATNRDLLPCSAPTGFGRRFNDCGPQFFRVGTAAVSEGAYAVREVRMLPEHLCDGPDDTVPPLYGSDTLFAQLKARMRGRQKDAIVLLHGFCSSFEATLSRSAELADRWRIDGERPPVIVFSWPSDGKSWPATRYYADRDDAALSGTAMARALLSLLGFLRGTADQPDCGQRLHLVAHSMGNWALRHAIQVARSMLGTDRLPQLFDNAFLMAADEDEDAFEHVHKLALLPRLAARVHVYHATSDRALMVSDLTKANPGRLGATGPRIRDGLDARIGVVDCTDVSATTLGDADHQYYRLRPEVIDDVCAVLDRTLPDDIWGRRWLASDRAWRILPFDRRETPPRDPMLGRVGATDAVPAEA